MRTTSLWTGRLCAAGIVVASMCLGRAASADTLITFDDLSNNTTVANQYLTQGALFTGTPGDGETISSGLVTPFSGPNVLINSPIDHEFTGGPLTVQFTTPQQTVSLYGGYVLFNAGKASLPGTLTAFDANGNVVAIDGPLTVPGGTAAAQQFSVSSSQVNISSITLDFGTFNYTVIDNLQFGGGAAITPPASGPPVVTISTIGGTFDLLGSPFFVVGSVAGEELLPTVQVTLQGQNAPPGQTPSIQVVNLPLDASGHFNQSLFPDLLVGNYVLTVTATNLAGQTGSASITFFNTAPALSSQTGFQYAIRSGQCEVDVFQNFFTTAILALFPATGKVIAIDPLIFPEWSTVYDPYILRGSGTLGCPTGPAALATPETSSLNTNNSHTMYLVQDFEHGRVYAITHQSGFPPGADDGKSSYTPRVFADAIDALSTYVDPGASGDVLSLQLENILRIGVREVGIPVGDPTFDLADPDPAFLFQHFQTPSYCGPDTIPMAQCVPLNTLEIRGVGGDYQFPNLWVERNGGSMLDYESAMDHPPNSGGVAPAVWEQFPCKYQTQTGTYACTVNRPHYQSLAPKSTIVAGNSTQRVPLYTTTSQIPNEDGYCGVLPSSWDTDAEFGAGVAIGTTTEWSAIPTKSSPSADEPTNADNIDILSMGWVCDSNAAGNDFPATHEDMQCTDPASADLDTAGYTALGCVAGPLGCIVGYIYGNQQTGNGEGCWADWGIRIRPLALNIPDPNFSYVFTPHTIPATPGIAPPFWNLEGGQADPVNDGVSNALPPGRLEVEWEDMWQHQMIALPGNHTITPGALAIVNGRWMIDCGHPPVHSEIHPPNMVIEVENSQGAKDPNGNPVQISTEQFVTRAQVWFNELYTGGQVTTHIWPPPRPSPEAQLGAYFLSWVGPGQHPSSTVPGGLQYPFAPNTAVAGSNATMPTVTVSFSGDNDGLIVKAIGPGWPTPSSSHQTKDTGQVMNPTDDPSFGSGAVGDYMATWYVGWNQ